jgi:hypothetical protein
MKPCTYRLLFLALLLTSAHVSLAQQSPDAPPEIGIREHLPAPKGGIALYEHRTDLRPVRHWSAGRKLYVQTAPDTVWFRVLIAGNSYFVRQREMPVPGWRVGR